MLGVIVPKKSPATYARCVNPQADTRRRLKSEAQVNVTQIPRRVGIGRNCQEDAEADI
jgi:hypothetical protein